MSSSHGRELRVRRLVLANENHSQQPSSSHQQDKKCQHCNGFIGNSLSDVCWRCLQLVIKSFRVSELQEVLVFSGKRKVGKKNELCLRVIGLARSLSPDVVNKILKIYESSRHLSASTSQTSHSSVRTARTPEKSMSVVGPSIVPSTSSSVVSTHLSSSNISNTRYFSVHNLCDKACGPSIIVSSKSDYPLNPDVRMKKLPFYLQLGELLKPSTLRPHLMGYFQDAYFTFSLTPQQAQKIVYSSKLHSGKQEYAVQIQLRFCLLETTSEQEDNFPSYISVSVDKNPCILPNLIPSSKVGVEARRPSVPVDITPYCVISPTVSNHLHVSWFPTPGRCHVVSIYLVQKLTSEDLLQALKAKRPQYAEVTKSLIHSKLREDNDCEIASTSLRCSLLCPLGKMRIELPCRANTCSHLQCFDASLYILMNERKATWTCPVCDKPALYDNLVIDEYFQQILSADSECSEVTLHKDGTWTKFIVNDDIKEQLTKEKQSEFEVETLSDDEEFEDTSKEVPFTSGSKERDIEVVTLDSDSDGDTSSTFSAHSRDVSHDVRINNDVCSNEVHVLRSTVQEGHQAVTASPQIICLDSPAGSPHYEPQSPPPI